MYTDEQLDAKAREAVPIIEELAAMIGEAYPYVKDRVRDAIMLLQAAAYEGK